jgi:hypothetical protein
MKTMRWIFGFPLATVLSLGIIFIFVNYSFLMEQFANRFVSIAFGYILLFFSFSLWVFLTCLFMPAYKKYMGLLPMLLSTGFFIFVLYKGIRGEVSFNSLRDIAIPISGVYLGMLVGYFVSYFLFKDKGWAKKKINPRIAELGL